MYIKLIELNIFKYDCIIKIKCVQRKILIELSCFNWCFNWYFNLIHDTMYM